MMYPGFLSRAAPRDLYHSFCIAAASRSRSANFATLRRNCSSVLNRAFRNAVIRSLANHGPTIWAPMHMTLTSSCSTL